MCGIAGHIDKTLNSDRTNQIVSSMLDSIRHRGPDDSGIYNEEFFGTIGMRRLSIQDLSLNAHQPMFDKDLLVCIVYNGEIYNANKKKNELLKDGYVFKSNSDTEVILNLYLKYNEDCLLHLEGMFAFAIIDKRFDKINPKLFIARDQIGIKPLYYSWINDCFSFCSEVLPFVVNKVVDPKLDLNSIRQLLNLGSIKQPNTIFANINMLMPGHKLIFHNGVLKIEKYWDLKNGLDQFRFKKDFENNAITAIDNSLKNSVEEQLCGDVKIGSFLSGGIDSSLIAALLSQVSSQKVNTYSVGFRTDLNLKSELTRAKVTSKYLNTDHHEIIVDEDYVLNNIDNFICSLDQPSVDGINTFIISDYTSQQVKVALSGTGGDELFAGYPWFRSMQNFKKIPFSNFLKESNFLNKSFLGGKLEKLSYNNDFISFFSSLHQVFSLNELNSILNFNNDFHQLKHQEFQNSDVLFNEKSILNRTSGLLLNTFLLNQLLRDIDACSMSKSLEVRVPFLSLDVIYNALNIDDSFKLGQKDLSAPVGSYKRNGEKSILFELAKKYLPQGFDLVEKNGFTLPFDDWLKGPLREKVENAILYLIHSKSEFFNEKALVKIKNDYYSSKSQWYKIWVLFVLGVWLKKIDELSSQ